MTRSATARADSALRDAQRSAAKAVQAARKACTSIVTHEQLAAGMCASRGLLSQYADEENDATISIARASLAPAPFRAAIAAYVAGPTHRVVPAETHEHHTSADMVREFAEAMTAATMAEADDYITPEEAERELAELEGVEKVLVARRALCRRAIAERGLRVGNANVTPLRARS